MSSIAFNSSIAAMKVPRIEPAVNTANHKMIVEVMSRSFRQTGVLFIKIRSAPYEVRFLNTCVDQEKCCVV